MQQKIGFEIIRSSSLNRKTAENQSDMATANIEGRDLEYDTTMCGTSKVCFSTLVKYLRDSKVKCKLANLSVGCWRVERVKIESIFIEL